MIEIIIAEDNKLILETIAHSLAREGFKVTKANDGKECLTYLEKNHVDLVITDLYMPNVNGLEVISTLKNEWKREIPVMVLSVDGSEENVLKAFEFGADDFMIKPFSLSELNVRVKKLLGSKGN